MKGRLLAILGTSALTIIVLNAPSTAGQVSKQSIFDVRRNPIAQRVFGPTTIIFVGMNPLRQSSVFTATQQIQAAPAVSSVFSAVTAAVSFAPPPSTSSTKSHGPKKTPTREVIPCDPDQLETESAENIANCVTTLRNNVSKLQIDLRDLSTAETGIILTSDAVLDKFQLIDAGNFGSYIASISTCIFGDQVGSAIPVSVPVPGKEFACPKIMYSNNVWPQPAHSDVDSSTFYPPGVYGVSYAVTKADRVRFESMKVQQELSNISVFSQSSGNGGPQSSQPTVIVNVNQNGTQPKATPSPKPATQSGGLSPAQLGQLNGLGAIVASDATVVSTLVGYSDSVLRGLTMQSFVYTNVQACGGLLSSGSNNQIVLTVSGQAVSSATIQGSGAPNAGGQPQGANGQAQGGASQPGGKYSPAQASSSQSGATNQAGGNQMGSSQIGGGSTQAYDVTVVCRTPVFLSVGSGYGFIQNSTFTNVSQNTSGGPTPQPSATPLPGKIVPNSKGGRVDVFTIANFRLKEGQRAGLFLSGGIGIPVSNPNGIKADAIAGFSAAWDRSFLVTLGAIWGPTTNLAPGYKAYGPIPGGASPPTTTNTVSRLFLGISFGF